MEQQFKALLTPEALAVYNQPLIENWEQIIDYAQFLQAVEGDRIPPVERLAGAFNHGVEKGRIKHLFTHLVEKDVVRQGESPKKMWVIWYKDADEKRQYWVTLAMKVKGLSQQEAEHRWQEVFGD